MRVVAAAASAGALDVALADGPSVASGVEFGGTTDYLEVPGGPDVAAGDSRGWRGDGPAGRRRRRLGVQRPCPGRARRRAQLMPLLDAAGMSAMPAGGVATGAGGTADGTGDYRPLAVGVALLATAGLLVGRREPAGPPALLRRRPEALAVSRHRAPRRAVRTARLVLAAAAVAGAVLALSDLDDRSPVEAAAAAAAPPSVALEATTRPAGAGPHPRADPVAGRRQRAHPARDRRGRRPGAAGGLRLGRLVRRGPGARRGRVRR